MSTAHTPNADLTRLLTFVVGHLDIPKSLYEKAAGRHRSLADWLQREGSKLAEFDPDIRPQGSFRYGTVNRPLRDDDEYDLDNVCLLRRLGALMPETMTERYERWGLGALLDRFPGLRVAPSVGSGLTVAGELSFRVQGPVGEPLEDAFAVEIRVPRAFPLATPSAFETGGRIPDDFHKLDGGALCLGAPAALRLGLGPTSTLTNFVERFVVPYLFGFSYFTRHGVMPFGELAHGNHGLRQHFATVFSAPDSAAAEVFVYLASLTRRRANKESCPCRSGRRLGRCHHRRVNALRDRLGRTWFREQYRHLREES